MADYKYENDTWTFYFDYIIDNYPVFFSNFNFIIPNSNQKDMPTLNHIAEVSVKNGGVSEYRRYIPSFDIEYEVQVVDGPDFISVLNEFVLTTDSENYLEELSFFDFGYKIEHRAPSGLGWSIEIGESSYLNPLLRKPYSD